MNPSSTKSRIVAVVLLAGVLPLLVGLAAHALLGDARRVQESLHAAVELAGTCIALSVATLLWLRLQHENASPHLLWVMAALVAMGLVDGLHGVHGISIQSWQRHGATLLGGALFGLVWMPVPRAVIRRKGVFVLTVVGLALALGSWWGSEWMPVTWDPVGLYILPVKAANALGGLGFLAAALFFCLRYLRQSNAEDLVFAILTVLFGVSSLFFSFSHTWAADWWVMHGFRLLAYAILLVAAYGVVVGLYRHNAEYAQELEGRVHERTVELATANGALRETNARYRTLVENIPQKVFVKDREFRWVSINEHLARDLGIRPEDVVGKVDSDLFPKELADKYRADDTRIMETGKGEEIEERYLQDGRETWVQTRKTPMRDANGEVVGVCGVFADITERKLAEEALRSSERRFREMAESLPQLVWTCRGDGTCDYLSPQWVAYTGIPEAEQLGFRWLEQLHPDDREPTVTAWNAAAGAGSLFDVAFRIRRHDGLYRWFKTRGLPLRDEAGLVVKWFGTNTDIDDQRHTEEALRSTEERFRVAAESVSDVVYEWDLKDTLTWFGDVDGLMGYPAGGFPRTLDGWVAMLHPEDTPRVSAAIEAQLRGAAPYDVEYRVAAKDGAWRWWSARGTVLKNQRGEPQRWIGALADVTERKRAEEALRDANERLEGRVLERTAELARSKELLAETGRLARVGGWEIDLKKNELSWTDVVYQIHEVGPEFRPTVATGIQFYAPEAVPVISEAVRRGIEDGEPWDLELPLITAKGNRLWVRAIGQGYRENGVVVRVGGVFHDITARKLADDELRRHRDQLEELVNERTAELANAVQDLERSNKELEQFAYVASHDLQEPLRMVSSYTQLLGQRYEGQLDEKAKKYIDYAVDGAVRMQRLINDLLTYSRVGTRGKPLELTDAHAVLGEAVVNLAAAIEESGAMITNDDLPTVRSDASQLVQVFQNLLANAIKFRGAEPPRIHVSARDQGREWVFSVRDNGIGIERQYAARVFVIFQRLHTRQEYPGTGIGLALCKRIVERHGGHIWFESEPSAGSTFFFTVPK